MWMTVMWANHILSILLFIYAFNQYLKKSNILIIELCIKLGLSIFIMTVLISGVKLWYDHEPQEYNDVIFGFLLILGNGLLAICYNCWYNSKKK